MSVRRLAEKQPESFEFTPENKAWAAKEIAKYPPGRQASAVIALSCLSRAGDWVACSVATMRPGPPVVWGFGVSLGGGWVGLGGLGWVGGGGGGVCGVCVCVWGGAGWGGGS